MELDNRNGRHERSVLFFRTVGTPNAAHAAQAIFEEGLLSGVITGIALKRNGLAFRLAAKLPNPLREVVETQLGLRSWLPDDVGPVHSYPSREIVRIILSRTGLGRSLGFPPDVTLNWMQSGLEKKCISEFLSKSNIRLVYAYADRALKIFKCARERGIICVCDCTAASYVYAKKIWDEEAENFPQLKDYLPKKETTDELLPERKEELALADHICVASSFTRKTIISSGFESVPIHVNPYGAPTDLFSPRVKSFSKFRVLYCGNITPQKGIHYLLEAWNSLRLPQAELILVGELHFPVKLIGSSYSVCIKGRIPRSKLIDVYTSADIFVFPTLCDGFGLVILEAMACGVPVIATENSGAPDVVEHGKDGFVVPIRDPQALAHYILWCYSHPDELQHMKMEARLKAEKLSWRSYREGIARTIRTIVQKR